MKRFPQTRRRAVVLALALGALLPAAPAVHAAPAAEWPTKPVRILVGAPPGGTADILARLFAQELQRPLGQPVVVDYKVGAAGTIAVQNMLSAPRDGYTLLLIQKGIASEVPQAIKVSYDPFKDIVPLVQLTRQGLVLVGNPGLPAKNLAELVTYVKANPGKIDVANFGIGLRGHTIGVQFNRLAGLDTGAVSYRGSPPALQDIMGGQVPLMFDGPATSMPFIKAGKLRAFAVAFPQRIAALPHNVRIYCGHEYTLANGRFAEHAEPENSAVRARLQQVKLLRDQGKITLPTTVAEERETNPFVRVTNTEEFARLRAAKDSFR